MAEADFCQIRAQDPSLYNAHLRRCKSCCACDVIGMTGATAGISRVVFSDVIVHVASLMLLLLVQYAAHVEAVRAIVGLNNTALGGKILKAFWGKQQAGRAGPERVLTGLLATTEFLPLQQQQDCMQQGAAQLCATVGGYVD